MRTTLKSVSNMWNGLHVFDKHIWKWHKQQDGQITLIKFAQLKPCVFLIYIQSIWIVFSELTLCLAHAKNYNIQITQPRSKPY